MTEINQEEYEILKELDDKWKWIARDEDRGLYAFTKKPVRKDGPSSFWWDAGGWDAEPYSTLDLFDEIHLFQFIQWEDEEPHNISELIEEYEHKEFYDYVGWKYAEREETEVEKDIEWLRNEVNELPIRFIGFSILKQREELTVSIDDVLELIDQLDEPEVKQLYEKIEELESYNDELIRDNNQFRNELDSLDSQFMGLHTSYDEQIKSLEYELFVEKTREPKNKFYWFTAKKTPLVADVSYLSYEDTLYGFKGVPNYRFIENHDLRFVTNCSLDDLVEQFR